MIEVCSLIWRSTVENTCVGTELLVKVRRDSALARDVVLQHTEVNILILGARREHVPTITMKGTD